MFFIVVMSTNLIKVFLKNKNIKINPIKNDWTHDCSVAKLPIYNAAWCNVCTKQSLMKNLICFQ